MNKITENLIARKAAELSKAADEQITMSRRVYSLEIAVALLGGIVLGMIISPRKKVSYKIASNNRINDSGDVCDEDEPGEEEEENCGEEDKIDCCKNSGNGKFIKL